MMLDYFYGQSGELFAYFRIPKALFQDSRFRQLSTDARTLYGILLDRMSLSAKNSWVDKPKIKNRGYFAHHDGQPHHLWKADRQSNPARLWPEDQCIRADDSSVCPCR